LKQHLLGLELESISVSSKSAFLLSGSFTGATIGSFASFSNDSFFGGCRPIRDCVVVGIGAVGIIVSTLSVTVGLDDDGEMDGRDVGL
jgi:hypothetical protein